MPERKKPLFDIAFVKGFAVGYFFNIVFNKYAVIGAMVGLAAGISSEQRDPGYWPNISDKAREAVEHFKEIYRDQSDDKS